MKTVYKYSFTITDYQKIKMPVGAKILMVTLQNEIPCLWALVDTDMSKSEKYIRIVGTGHPIEDNAIYIGSFLMHHERLVFHVFEID